MEKKTQTTGTSPEELLSLPDREQSRGHYTTPPDFFSQLNDRILTSLPDMEESPGVVFWWTKARPIVYLAACFVGLMLCFRVVQEFEQTPPPTTSSAGASMANLVTSSEEDEWMLYYSEYASRAESYQQELDYALEVSL